MSSGKDRNKHDGRFDDTGRAGAGRGLERQHGDGGPETPHTDVRAPREPDETFDAGPRPSPEDESQNR